MISHILPLSVRLTLDAFSNVSQPQSKTCIVLSTKTWKLSVSLLVQYNFDFDLELIEMSLRIYSCVSLIAPLSNDVHLPCTHSHMCVYVILVRVEAEAKAKAMLSVNRKIKWYNTREYFIINDFTMLNNFRKHPFPFSEIYRIAFIFRLLASLCTITEYMQCDAHVIDNVFCVHICTCTPKYLSIVHVQWFLQIFQIKIENWNKCINQEDLY